VSALNWTADHVHRSYKYNKKVDGGFECDECRRLHTVDRKKWQLKQLAGTVDVNVTDRRQVQLFKSRVERLLERGYTIDTIAKHVGTAPDNLRRIIHSGQRGKSMRTSTLEGLTAFWEEVQAGQAVLPSPRKDKVNVELARAAVRGLQLRGWTGKWIGEQVGLVQRSVSAIARGDTKSIDPDVEQRLIELAKRYGTTDGPSKTTRSRAEQRGWESTAMRDELL